VRWFGRAVRRGVGRPVVYPTMRRRRLARHLDGYSFNAVCAGPASRSPSRANFEPCSGQDQPSDVPSTVAPWWVHRRFNAV